MKTILVSTDLSERSDRAVRRALRIAGATGAKCHVLYVCDDSLPEDICASLRSTAEARLRQFLDGATVGGKSAEALCEVGDPVSTVCDTAARLNADLVVLGLHRPRPFLDALRETTMERLVRLLRQPVLLVRDPADHDYRSIVAAISFSPACAAALRAAHAIAPHAGISAFHAIHIPFAGLTGEGPGSDTARYMVKEAETAREAWIRAESLPPELSGVTMITDGLNAAFTRQIEASKADLIALGAHTRSSYLANGLGGFAASLIRHPPADLLIARPAG